MPLPPSSPPLTRAERSDYGETSLHADVLAYIEALRAPADNRLHIEDFGSTPEDRLLPLLVLSRHGHFTHEAATTDCSLAGWSSGPSRVRSSVWRVRSFEPVGAR